jgi:hypothetical protein
MVGAKTEIRLLELKWSIFVVCNHRSALIHLLWGTTASVAYVLMFSSIKVSEFHARGECFRIDALVGRSCASLLPLAGA